MAKKLPRLTMQELPAAITAARLTVSELAGKLSTSWGLSDQEFKDLERTYLKSWTRLGKLEQAELGDTAKLLRRLKP